MGTLIKLSISDRIDLIRSILRPFPDMAEGEDEVVFGRLVDQLGAEDVFAYLRRRGMVHAAVAAHRKSEVVAAEDGLFWLFREVSVVIRDAHRHELACLAKAFEAAGVPLIAFKGVAMDAALANTDAPSFGSDIDILVARRDLDRAVARMRELGYVPDLRIRNGKARQMPSQVVEAVEQSVYSFGQCAPLERLIPIPELAAQSGRIMQCFPTLFCFSGGQFCLKLSVDLHYTLNHIADDIGTRVKPAEEVWLNDTQRVDIDGVPVATLSPRVLSWLLPHRLYVDAMLLNDTSIKALCHLRLLQRYDAFDAGHVRHTAQRYPYLAPSLYYVLRAFDQLRGSTIGHPGDPEEIRTAITPLMNVGDCLPTLLDIGIEFTLGDPRQPTGADQPVSVRVW
ncbi:nucleotidyltransferase family protein [Streptomyces sp. NPDC058295]|uniref:nucleotidyltransferase family protein n=1 Tax=Streptomyces sp. NPDC058295 TaxID=3346431 RepID=UPI0036EBD960